MHPANVPPAAGSLFVVSTPIGNLGDMTFRAVEVLRSVSVVLAEDTRHSRTLLRHFEIGTATVAYHEHNEASATPGVLRRLMAGDDVALISDAGTPLLSDPGARLVSAVAEASIQVVPVPGASALLGAMVVSALDSTRFTFFGFLPRRGRERRKLLGELAALTHTAVLYEAPARLVDTLQHLAADGGGARRATVARELTKKFEDVRRGTLDELTAYYTANPPRGEVVIVLAGQDAAPTHIAEDELRRIASGMRAGGTSTRDIVRRLVAEHGVPRNLAYRITHEGDS